MEYDELLDDEPGRARMRKSGDDRYRERMLYRFVHESHVFTIFKLLIYIHTTYPEVITQLCSIFENDNSYIVPDIDW